MDVFVALPLTISLKLPDFNTSSTKRKYAFLYIDPLPLPHSKMELRQENGYKSTYFYIKTKELHEKSAEFRTFFINK